MSEVTKILAALERGEPVETERLLPLVYDELRQLAAQKLAWEQPGATLQATALVHEAFLRLVGSNPADQPVWNSRGHFFAAAAEAMRRILIEAARRRKATKRGGGAVRHELAEGQLESQTSDDDLLAIHEVLDRLASIDPQAALLVKLRFFVGLNMSEVAATLGISVRNAHDLWSFARAWLRNELKAE